MGGGFSNGGGELTVSKSTISDNTAEHGGGIANVSGTLIVSNSTIASNSAPANAGGIDNSTPVTLTVINSIVSGNSSGGAGGISNLGTLVVNNSTITDNSAQAGGPTLLSRPASLLSARKRSTARLSPATTRTAGISSARLIRPNIT
jgi:Right handed beta helix region